MLILLLACSEPPVPMAPEAHSWQDEAKLVVDGLEEVEDLWSQDQRTAARTLAERVYTDRWEPRLEPAEREIEGPVLTAASEYAWGQLLVELDRRAGKDKVVERIAALEDKTRSLAEAAARKFPSPPDVDAPPPMPESTGSKPIVPSVRPRWEAPEE